MSGFADGIDGLDILLPQAIPTAEIVEEWIARNSTGAFGDYPAGQATFSENKYLTNLEMAESLSHVLTHFPAFEDNIHLGANQPDDAAHDAYFHVSRIDGPAPAIFARMALSARLILLQEVADAPIAVSEPLVGPIDRALADLILCVYGDQACSRQVSQWQTRGEASHPMRRWIRGHQIFAALSQGLIYSFQCMGSAIRMGDGPQVRRWAELSVSLLQGSGATFVFTGDFSVEEYGNIVRPSMMPPASAICLSGLMSVDHRFLMQVLRDMRPALKSLHELEGSLHDRLQEELGKVYDLHIHVCERFVGERPSLLTARHAKKSGPALIEQFKTLRMKAFNSPAPMARLANGPAAQSQTTRAVAARPVANAPLVTAEKEEKCTRNA